MNTIQIYRDTKLDRWATFKPVLKRNVKAILLDEKFNQFVETGKWQWDTRGHLSAYLEAWEKLKAECQ